MLSFVESASLASIEVRAGQTIALSTFDGAQKTTQTWKAENDPVMGGVSSGAFNVDKANRIGVWTGVVKIVPKLGAPGFCTVRTSATFPDISSAEGLLVTAQLVDSAPGALSTFKVSMDSSVRDSPRQGEFEGKFTATATESTLFIPFASMSQSWRGQREGGPPSKKQLAAIVGLGFNQDGTAGSFGLAITSISAGSAPTPGPAPGPAKELVLASFADGKSSTSAEWYTTNDPVMGGVSAGNFSIQADRGEWAGEVRIVPKLQAPGFCRVDAKLGFLPKDVSDFDGITYRMNHSGGDEGPVSTMMAVIEGGIFERYQFTASLRGSGNWPQEGAFVPFSTFRPFGIRPEPGNAPTKAQLKHLSHVGLLADGTKGTFDVKIFSVAASTAVAPGPGPAPPTPAAGIDLFKFGAVGVKPWQVTNDPVMGGRSKSSFTVGTDGAGSSNIGLFTGDVAIVPSLKAPGFCNAFVEIAKVDMSSFDAIEITLRSHGPLRAFKSSWGGKGVPQDPNCHHPGCKYQMGTFKAGFNVSEVSASGSVQRVVIPWKEYTYRWSDFTGGCTDHGAVCCSTEHPEVCPQKTALSSVTQIGIWGEGTAGDFALDIFSVRAIKL